MTTIWKYSLVGLSRQGIMMPKDAAILSIQMQGKDVCMWALVNPLNDNEERRFEIFGTGHKIEDHRRKYIGTIQDGPFVWHCFERLK